MSAEEWLDIPGMEGSYRVSSRGRVLSRRGILRKLNPDRRGYLQLHMTIGGRHVTRKVHALVALAFLGVRPEGLQVRHLNGNKLDNRSANLAYGTPSQNTQDNILHGTHWPSRVTHCPWGHEYDEENTHMNPRGQRVCRKCGADKAREKRAAR